MNVRTVFVGVLGALVIGTFIRPWGFGQTTGAKIPPSITSITRLLSEEGNQGKW